RAGEFITNNSNAKGAKRLRLRSLLLVLLSSLSIGIENFFTKARPSSLRDCPQTCSPAEVGSKIGIQNQLFQLGCEGLHVIGIGKQCSFLLVPSQIPIRCNI